MNNTKEYEINVSNECISNHNTVLCYCCKNDLKVPITKYRENPEKYFYLNVIDKGPSL